jgi:hypothetical protein
MIGANDELPFFAFSSTLSYSIWCIFTVRAPNRSITYVAFRLGYTIMPVMFLTSRGDEIQGGDPSHSISSMALMEVRSQIS